MPRLTLSRLRKLVRALRYVVSIHAAEELEDDDLTVLDLENILLSGQIIARQRDRRSHETKHLVRGLITDGGLAEAVVKIGPTGKLFVITVYRV